MTIATRCFYRRGDLGPTGSCWRVWRNGGAGRPLLTQVIRNQNRCLVHCRLVQHFKVSARHSMYEYAFLGKTSPKRLGVGALACYKENNSTTKAGRGIGPQKLECHFHEIASQTATDYADWDPSFKDLRRSPANVIENATHCPAEWFAADPEKRPERGRRGMPNLARKISYRLGDAHPGSTATMRKDALSHRNWLVVHR